MNDTTPKMEEKMHEMIRAKTPEERAKMGASMIETSKYLITQSLLRENPHLSDIELLIGIFLKFYGDDFSSEKKEKIIQHLQSKLKQKKSF